MKKKKGKKGTYMQFPVELRKWLESESERTGSPMSAIVRQAVDEKKQRQDRMRLPA